MKEKKNKINNKIKSIITTYLLLDFINKIIVLSNAFNLYTFILLILNICIYTFIID